MDRAGGRRTFRFWGPSALALVPLALVAPSADAQDLPSRGVTHVRVEGPLGGGTLPLVHRALSSAIVAEHEFVVLELDTPGGEIDRMKKICGAIERAQDDGLRVIAWVHDEALSAGTWIAITCEKVYMRTSGTIGAAQAVQVTPWGIQPVEEKYASAYRGWVRAWAEKHHRSPVVAEAMVDELAEVREVVQNGVRRIINGDEWDDLVDRGETPELIRIVNPSGELLTLTASEAVQLEFADGPAESLDEVLDKIGMRGAEIVTIEPSRSEDLLGTLNDLRLLLLFTGLVLAFVEMKVPGFGIAGILAIVCFAVLFAGQYLVGLADIPDIVLGVVGVGLIAVELFLVPGTIWVGLLGMICLAAGLVLSQLGPGVDFSSSLDRVLAFKAVFNMVLTGVASLVGMYALSRFLPEAPVLHRVVLAPEGGAFAEGLPEAQGEHAGAAQVGAAGLALTDLRPVGKVALDANPSLEYEARAAGDALERDTRVRVVEVVGGRLVVEEEKARS